MRENHAICVRVGNPASWGRVQLDVIKSLMLDKMYEGVARQEMTACVCMLDTILLINYKF